MVAAVQRIAVEFKPQRFTGARAAHRAHHILDHLDTGERASQVPRQPGPRDGEDFVDDFEDRVADPGQFCSNRSA
jgi:hypothetical protein